MERKWLEEKAAREALESKVKSLKKKVKELKGNADADEMLTGAVEPVGRQSRSNSLDETGCINRKEHAITSEGNDSLGSEQRKVTAKSNKDANDRDETKAAAKNDSVSASAQTESKESVDVAETKSALQRRSSDPIMHSKAAMPPKISLTTPSKGILQKSKSDFGKQSTSSKTHPVTEAPKAAHGISEATSDTMGERVSPPRPRGSTAGNMLQSKFLKKPQAIPVTGDASGQINAVSAVPSSGDSLGSASDFDPLRVGHNMASGDGSMSIASEPVALEHQAAPTSGSSVLSFVSAPAPASSIDFDPLSTCHQDGTFAVPESNVQGVHPVSAASQHNYSQSMPNFVVDPTSMVMAFPVHQVNMNLPSSSGLPNQLQQGWVHPPQQQPVPIQNQYLPMQYNATNMAAPVSQPLQQYPCTTVEVSQEQHHPAALNTSSVDPFDELASRRAPGAAGQPATQQQQPQAQNGSNQPNQSS